MRVFVFGSNLAGRHGKGAALFARKNHGAIYGQGWGLQGSSFAIPTKGYLLEPRTFNEIKQAINEFLTFAEANPDLEFDLTPVGCGLAGWRQEDIKPLFKDKSNNVHFTKDWRQDYNEVKEFGE